MNSAFGPQEGDVVIRGSFSDGFAVFDAVTERIVTAAGLSFGDAIREACACASRYVWQQQLDARGRPIGEPLRLPLKSEALTPDA